MSLYAPSPLIVQCGVSAGYVISRPSVSSTTGAVAVADYWDHAAGVFNAPYDKAKHLVLFTRTGVDAADPDFTDQLASVPLDALADRKAMARIYTVGSDGERADLYKALDPAKLRAAVGL